MVKKYIPTDHEYIPTNEESEKYARAANEMTSSKTAEPEEPEPQIDSYIDFSHLSLN